MPVLGVRALNRALLARQHLLERAPWEAARMIEHLVGMQAQSPQDPYVALWSRVQGFAPGALSDAIAERRAVRMTLMRSTIHLATADDAVAIRPVVQDVVERVWASSTFRRDLAGVPIGEVVAAGRELLDGEALTASHLAERLASRWPGVPASSLAFACTFHLPLVQVPPRGLWRRGGRATWRSASTWLGRPVPTDGVAPDALVLRYLAAFGPATVQDVATWSRLTGVRAVMERLRPGLRSLQDEQGRELFDVPDGPLPDPTTPAPPRFLPEYDNIALSHRDRSRIIAPASFGRLTGFVGTFLVDGFVSGQWRLDRGADGATIVLDPFVALDDGQRTDLVDEAARLARWAAPEATRHVVTFGVARSA